MRREQCLRGWNLLWATEVHRLLHERRTLHQPEILESFISSDLAGLLCQQCLALNVLTLDDYAEFQEWCQFRREEATRAYEKLRGQRADLTDM